MKTIYILILLIVLLYFLYKKTINEDFIGFGGMFAISNTVSSLGRGGGLGGSIGNVVGGLGGSIGNVVGGLGGSIGNVAGGLGGSIRNVAGGLGGSIGNVAGGLGGSIGNAVKCQKQVHRTSNEMYIQVRRPVSDYTLYLGQILEINKPLYSKDRNWRLIYQDDGNLCLKNAQGVGTCLGLGMYKAGNFNYLKGIVQLHPDGMLIVYGFYEFITHHVNECNDNKEEYRGHIPVWASSSRAGTDAVRLQITNDGVVYIQTTQGKILWSWSNNIKPIEGRKIVNLQDVNNVKQVSMNMGRELDGWGKNNTEANINNSFNYKFRSVADYCSNMNKKTSTTNLSLQPSKMIDSNVLYSGQVLGDKRITSQDGRFTLKYFGDGNLCLHGPIQGGSKCIGTNIYTIKAGGRYAPHGVRLDEKGNLVIYGLSTTSMENTDMSKCTYTSNKAQWPVPVYKSTNNTGDYFYRLYIDNTGVVIIERSDGLITWQWDNSGNIPKSVNINASSPEVQKQDIINIVKWTQNNPENIIVTKAQNVFKELDNNANLNTSNNMELQFLQASKNSIVAQTHTVMKDIKEGKDLQIQGSSKGSSSGSSSGSTINTKPNITQTNSSNNKNTDINLPSNVDYYTQQEKVCPSGTSLVGFRIGIDKYGMLQSGMICK